MSDDVQAFIGDIEPPPVEPGYEPGLAPRQTKVVPEKEYYFFRVDFVNPDGRAWRAYRVSSCEKHAIDAVIGSYEKPINVIRIRRFNRLELLDHLRPHSMLPKSVLTKPDLQLAHSKGLLTKFEIS